MTLPDYGKIAEDRFSTEIKEWAAPFEASLRSRVLFLALFQEGLRAASDMRRKATRIIFHERTTCERFDLKINGRCVGFERYAADVNTKFVHIHREGFPPALVSFDERVETLEVPDDWPQAVGLAGEQIGLALDLLLTKLE